MALAKHVGSVESNVVEELIFTFKLPLNFGINQPEGHESLLTNAYTAL